MSDDKLWKIFSQYIRLRDTDSKGYGNCFTCGRPLYWKDGDAGHGIGRNHKATKFDERNNHLQCKPCNGFEEGRKEVYKEKVNKRYGPQTWDLLVIKSRSVYKWTRFEIEALTKHYEKEVARLKSEKNIY